ncbi:DUF4062 domain-containing protein [Paenibacillus arenosi]|uniref:DUF4062 domain-containing protein n=1 Tax=Paenibacillus arenosi TaxID=2774142 RepID=A0ABR9AXA8_9BACL|nr:DUF4062 domain-containing protein [Paenibacillus arenosi]
MKKKLQVFVSSTYEDLKKERQAAVQAILTSGHIPAGMELFSAGDETQKEIIKKWIDESDVYLLILGGRYGSIDNSTGKSYTHWEYQYAGEISKPRFAVVISEGALEGKIRTEGTQMMEKSNRQLYEEFRKEVLGKICKIFNDERDIELAVFQKMGEYVSREDLKGWVRGSEVPDLLGVFQEQLKLNSDNAKLSAEVTILKKQLQQKQAVEMFDGLTFEELQETLSKIKIEFPKELSSKENLSAKSILNLFFILKDDFATGITNQANISEAQSFVYYSIAPRLMTFKLLEKVKVAGVRYEKIQMSNLGFKFLKMLEIHMISKETSESPAKGGKGSLKTDDDVGKSSAPKKTTRKPRRATTVNE